MAFSKPSLPNDQAKSVVVGDQKWKARLMVEGPQCYKCKGFGYYVVVYPPRDKKLAFICKKELKVLGVVVESEEEEANEDDHDDVEHLGCNDLPVV